MVGWEARKAAIAQAIDDHERQTCSQRMQVLRAEQDERALSKLRSRRFAEWTLQLERETETNAQELWLFSHTRDREDPEDR